MSVSDIDKHSLLRLARDIDQHQLCIQGTDLVHRAWSIDEIVDTALECV